jgi:hypothetical protein
MYCFGWLQYEDTPRRPITCDAPPIGNGTENKPIVFDSGSGRFSNQTGAGPMSPAGPTGGVTTADLVPPGPMIDTPRRERPYSGNVTPADVVRAYR